MPEHDSLSELRGQLVFAFERDGVKSAVPKRPRRRRFAVVAAAAVLFVAILATLNLSSESDNFTVDEAVAAVASGAFDAPGPTRSGWLYANAREAFSTALTYSGNRFRLLVQSSQESWTGENREGWTRTSASVARFPTAEDRGRAEEAIAAIARNSEASAGKSAAPDFSQSDLVDPVRAALGLTGAQLDAWTCRVAPTSSTIIGTNEFGLASKLDSVPTDSEALLAQLRTRLAEEEGSSGLDDSDLIWENVSWALRIGSSAFTPQERISIIGVLALLPGVRTLGRVEDPAGRSAVAFERTNDAGLKKTIYFDPENSLPIYTLTQVGAKPPQQFQGMTPGTTVARYELVDFKRVSQAPSDLSETTSAPKSLALLFPGCPSR